MLKIDMRYRLKASVLAVALASLPFAASAAGLGRITVLSALGQPLKAELEVSSTRDEDQSLVAKVASADAFRQAGIEYVPALATLRFSRDIKERGGRRYIQITTDRPLNEPFIDMLVELNWASGRLVREYTFLLDPPDLAPVAAPAPVVAPEVKAVTRTEGATVQPVAKPSVPSTAEAVPAGDARPAVARPGSDLKAAPAPAKKTTEKVSAASVTRHKVAAGDTLSKIAGQTKPEGVSLDQMLVTLFHSNQEAFAGNNMNRLIAGKILVIPDAQEAGKVTENEAHREVVAQAADFNAYRKKLAAAVAVEPTREESAKQVASGKIAPRVEDKAAPAVNAKDKLEVSRTEVAKNATDGKGKALQSRIATLEEDLVARDRALQEANSRAADLEKSLTNMKKLAELKSQSGAALQQQAQPAKPVAAPPPPAPAPVKAPEPEKPLPPVAEAPKLAEPPKPAETAKPAEPVQPALAPKPAAPKKRPLPPPEPEPEPGFLEENGLLVFGGGGVIALLLGWLGFSASRRKRKVALEAETGTVASDFSAHSVFSTPTIAPPPGDLEPSQFSVTTSGMAASETTDAVSEADTFLAFGREAQAEEVLLAALEKEPERHALYLKLLEIYAGRRNRVQFEALAKRFHVQTGGVGPDWERVQVLGAELDPENALYRSAAAAVTVEEGAAGTGLDVAATAGLGAVALSELSEVSVRHESESTPAEHKDVAPEAAAINFDLDLDAPVVHPGTTQILSSAPDMSMLDFDLDLNPPEAPTSIAVPSMPLHTESPLEGEAVATTATDTTDTIGTATAPANTGSIDFNFDLEVPEATPVSSGEAVDDGSHDLAAPAVAAFDLSSISLELEAPPVATAPVSPAANLHEPLLFPSPVTASVPAVEPVTESADNSEVATKLELATAYEEMGDKEGARELYQEALMEGSTAQKDIARAKLASLA